jgi:hypothetical protein
VYDKALYLGLSSREAYSNLHLKEPYWLLQGRKRMSRISCWFFSNGLSYLKGLGMRGGKEGSGGTDITDEPK